jgi:hypothetical protein
MGDGGRRPEPALAKATAEPPGGLRLTASGADRGDRNDWYAGVEHRASRSEQHEVGAAGGPRPDASGGMRDVAVREHDLSTWSRRQMDSRLASSSIGIPFGWRAREGRRIARSPGCGDLRPGEGHNLSGGIVAVDHIDVVEVAPRRSQDQHSVHARDLPGCGIHEDRRTSRGRWPRGPSRR